MPKAKQQKCDNDRWQRAVRFHLVEGLGVEDIAIKLDCSVEAVRNEVQILRADGKLALMFGGAA